MIKYLSGRVKRTPQDRLSADRYDYLDIKQAEPNLADPATSPAVPSGSQYQLVSVPGYPGKRYWVPVGGGLIPGAISIFDEGTLVSAASSVTQLNFVGAAVTAQVSVQSPSGFPGIAATITVNPVTILDTPPVNPAPGELWWESDTGDLYLYYKDADSEQWVTTNTGGRGDPGDPGDKGQKGEVGAQGVSGCEGDTRSTGSKGCSLQDFQQAASGITLPAPFLGNIYNKFANHPDGCRFLNKRMQIQMQGSSNPTAAAQKANKVQAFQAIIAQCCN